MAAEIRRQAERDAAMVRRDAAEWASTIRREAELRARHAAEVEPVTSAPPAEVPAASPTPDPLDDLLRLLPAPPSVPRPAELRTTVVEPEPGPEPEPEPVTIIDVREDVREDEPEDVREHEPAVPPAPAGDLDPYEIGRSVALGSWMSAADFNGPARPTAVASGPLPRDGDVIDLRRAVEARRSAAARRAEDAARASSHPTVDHVPVETSIESKVHEVVRLAVRRTFSRRSS